MLLLIATDRLLSTSAWWCVLMATMATVEWQTTCTDLKQRGALLLETEEWTDCKLLVGPEEVPFRAHKLMLAMASPVFESMFFVEAQEEQDTFRIPDVHPTAFETLVNYIYTENISINSYNGAYKLYLAANKFLIMQLARVCTEFMCCNVTMDTACATHDVGYRFQDQQLMYESLRVIKMHIKEVLHHKSFLEADVETVAAIFGIPDLEVDEIELYQALQRYALAHASRKRSANPALNETGQEALTRRSLRKALQNIRFLTFSLEEFAKGPAQSGLLTQADALALLLNIANGDSPMPPGFTDVRQHRCQRPIITPPPVTTTSRGTLRVTVESAHAHRRSATSPSVNIGGRPWVLSVVPYLDTSTGSGSSEQYVAVFLRCSDTASSAWSCLVRVEFSLLARAPTPTPATTPGTTPGTTPTPHVSNKTTTIEKTFSSSQNEWGVRTFASWFDTQAASRGYLRDGALVFQAQLTILNTTVTG